MILLLLSHATVSNDRHSYFFFIFHTSAKQKGDGVEEERTREGKPHRKRKDDKSKYKSIVW